MGATRRTRRVELEEPRPGLDSLESTVARYWILDVQSSANRVSLEMRDDEEGVRLSGRGVGVDGMGAGHAGRVKFAWWTTRLDVPAGGIRSERLVDPGTDCRLAAAD